MIDTASNEDVPAIMAKGVAPRLDAIMRRHGGAPKPIEHANGIPTFPKGGSRRPGPSDVPLFDVEG